MDVDKIFNMFNGDNLKPTKEELNSLKKMKEFKETPSYKVGMYKKMLLNHHHIKHRLINLFKTPMDDFGMKEMEEVGEYIAHHRAWSYIEHCDLKEEIWRDSLIMMDDERLNTALKMSIHFFEELEEYEKCAFLKNIENFLKDSLDS